MKLSLKSLPVAPSPFSRVELNRLWSRIELHREALAYARYRWNAIRFVPTGHGARPKGGQAEAKLTTQRRIAARRMRQDEIRGVQELHAAQAAIDMGSFGSRAEASAAML